MPAKYAPALLALLALACSEPDPSPVDPLDLPHDWAVDLVDVFVADCELEATVADCELAIYVVPGHLQRVTVETDLGEVAWGSLPVRAAAGRLEGVRLGEGTLTAPLGVEYCGLPGEEIRWFDVRVRDLSSGLEVVERVELELPSDACGG